MKDKKSLAKEMLEVAQENLLKNEIVGGFSNLMFSETQDNRYARELAEREKDKKELESWIDYLKTIQ